MNRPLRRLLIGGVAVVTMLAVAPAIQALGAGNLTASFVASSDWGSGHEGKVTVTNGTDASVASWSIDFTLPDFGLSRGWCVMLDTAKPELPEKHLCLPDGQTVTLEGRSMMVLIEDDQGISGGGGGAAG